MEISKQTTKFQSFHKNWYNFYIDQSKKRLLKCQLKMLDLQGLQIGKKVAGGDYKVAGGDYKEAGGDYKLAGGDYKVAGGDYKQASPPKKLVSMVP